MTSAIQNNNLNSNFTQQMSNNSSIDYQQGQTAKVAKSDSVKVAQTSIMNEQMSKEEESELLKGLIKDANKQMASFNNGLEFQFHDDAGILSVAVVNTLTNEEIRRMPSKEAIELLSGMKEIIGKILDTQA
jgi:flagellar protein FlaG